MPSTSEKQRRFFGAELARKRAGKSTKTNMSEKQLSEFAGSVEHGSLEDITFHEDVAPGDSVTIYGFLAKDGQECHDAASTHEKLSGYMAGRDAHSAGSHKVPVDYFGPDTDYRAEEIDPHQYGKDWEPFPLRDYHKTEDDQWERGFRLEEQDEYDSTATPGTVRDSNPMSEAYGARSSGSMSGPRDVPDRRSFDSQREFARTNKKKSEEYAVDISGLDTKKGSKIR